MFLQTSNESGAVRAIALALLFTASFTSSEAAQSFRLEAGVARSDAARTAIHAAALVGIDYSFASLQMGVSFQPQAVKRETYESRFGQVGYVSREIEEDLNYVGMPFRVQSYFSRENRSGLFGRAGLEPRVLLNNRPGPGTSPDCSFCYEPISERKSLYPSWDLGIQLGLGWFFENATFPFFAELVGAMGLREMPASQARTTRELENPNDSGSRRNKSVMLIVGKSFSI